MKVEVTGDSLPVAICKLEKGEQVYTECGGMSWMTPNIKMETNTNGGFMKGLGRSLSGESLFMNTYTAEDENQEIAFASSMPGEILEFELKEGESVICQKRSFLAAEKSVDMKIHFRKNFGAGLFGGEGFIMQKLTGPGKVLIEVDGAVVRKKLEPGEELKVDNGYVAAMTEQVSLDITTVKGVKNVLFGGEGLFLTTLKGPGMVWLQSMPISKLAGSIRPYIPTGK